jgi:hypothetical protein
MTTDWHLDPSLARRYATEATDLGLASSVEAHLVGCARCRDLVGALVPTDRLDGIWDAVAAELDAPRPGPVERLLARLGMREDTARLIVTTPSLRLSWLTSLALVLGFAALTAGSGDRGRLVFLTLAPLLPVVGVAAAFAGPLDPIREVAAAAPYPRFRLLLLRALAVLATSVGFAAVAGALVIDDGWLAAGWLLPALALVSTTLALSARFDPAHAGGVVGLVWLLVVWGRAPLRQVSFAAFAPAAQLVYLLVTVAALTVFVAARTVFDYDRRGR